MRKLENTVLREELVILEGNTKQLLEFVTYLFLYKLFLYNKNKTLE